MTAAFAISAVLAAGWTAAATASLLLRTGQQRAALAAVVAAAHFAAFWPPLAPLVPGAWIAYAASAPTGRFDNSTRRGLAAGAGLASIAWAVVDVARADRPAVSTLLEVATVAAVIGVASCALRYRRADRRTRRALRWLAAAAVLLVGYLIVCAALYLMAGVPHNLALAAAGGLVVVPLAHLAADLIPSEQASDRAAAESVAAAGAGVLVAAVYLVVVVGINGAPHGRERGVLLASLIAATIVALLVVRVRQRLLDTANSLIGPRNPSTEESLTNFSARMSRSVPMDELLLQLAESLKATAPDTSAEIWTGASGALSRTVSVPARAGERRLTLGERERVVIAQSRIGGRGWVKIWLPEFTDRDADIRVVPVAHLGNLLGLIVVRRAATSSAFTEDDERALVEVARQLGLALHNVRLDSALQASLEELGERNAELQASRLRIVNAADASRREIERNLHDGAQQHLVALAVKLGITQSVAEDGDIATIATMLAALRDDVQVTITALRELAHGIYPPLLRDRGLDDALRAAGARSGLDCVVSVDIAGRYPEAVETALYFCALEAMQNAVKYAGSNASLQVRICAEAQQLRMEIADDGPGFDVRAVAAGHGFMNMRDRLGALGGELAVESAPGVGTTIRAVVPALPLSTIAASADR